MAAPIYFAAPGALKDKRALGEKRVKVYVAFCVGVVFFTFFIV